MKYKIASEVTVQEVNQEFFNKYKVTELIKREFQHVKTYVEFDNKYGQCFQMLVTKPESYQASIKEKFEKVS